MRARAHTGCCCSGKVLQPCHNGEHIVVITASAPEDKDALFEPAADKIYRHPTFYDIPEEVGHM